MILSDRIPVKKDLIPYQFDIELGGTLFNLRFDYNHLHDRFTVTLKKGKDVIVYGEPLVYGQKLFEGVFLNDGNYPAVDIVPLDLSGETDTVNWDTFCTNVFLWVDNGVTALVES